MKDIVMWLMIGFIAYLAIPIILCMILFLIAHLKGWRDPNITPIQILDRLTK